MFLTAVVSNDSSLCFQTLQDLESVSIFFESEACLSSLQVNASVLWACTFFRWWWWKSGSSPPEDERHVCAPLWIHYSQFRCLLHTPLLYLPSTFPALPLSCQIPLSVAQWSHLQDGITMMLRGLWWANWDKSAEFLQLLDCTPSTKWPPCGKSHPHLLKI